MRAEAIEIAILRWLGAHVRTRQRAEKCVADQRGDHRVGGRQRLGGGRRQVAAIQRQPVVVMLMRAPQGQRRRRGIRGHQGVGEQLLALGQRGVSLGARRGEGADVMRRCWNWKWNWCVCLARQSGRRCCVALLQGRRASLATKQRLRLRSLFHQHHQRRNIGIPFDQRWHGAEAFQRSLVELPDRRGHGSAVVVDDCLRRYQVTAQVQFAHRGGRDRLQGGQRIFAVVALVDIQVVDVEQQAAAGARGQRRQELRFAHAVPVEPGVGGHVLQQQLPLQQVLHLVHAFAQQVERGGVQRQGQQVVQVAVAYRAPAQVFGHQARCDAAHQCAHALEMLCGKSPCRAQAQPHAMQADRIIAPQLLQHMPVAAGLVEIVFGVDFEPVHRRPLIEELAMVRRAQADSHAQRARCSSRRGIATGHLCYGITAG
ncbi:hypothetical protein DUPY_01440 [Duganella phyllosphaerae]|uniref:Uncharacterized protein n=1 Tax=Duganella phyllosphaerae TaxID=762836 RepID=A0A1E7X877_9BURK|nr:hypothetical protein DUPY_01440 [Duganella phyllosphaerae]